MKRPRASKVRASWHDRQWLRDARGDSSLRLISLGFVFVRRGRSIEQAKLEQAKIDAAYIHGDQIYGDGLPDSDVLDQYLHLHGFDLATPLNEKPQDPFALPPLDGVDTLDNLYPSLRGSALDPFPSSLPNTESPMLSDSVSTSALSPVLPSLT